MRPHNVNEAEVETAYARREAAYDSQRGDLKLLPKGQPRLLA